MSNFPWSTVEKDGTENKANIRTTVENPVTDPIPVELVGDGLSGDIQNVFGSISSVASSTLTDVVTYTVPAGKTFFLLHIEVSGDNIAEYTVDIGGSTEAFKRTYFTHFNEDFEFKGVEVSESTTIRVKVEHNRTPLGSFEARIVGNLV